MDYGMVDLFTVLISYKSKVDGPYIINEWHMYTYLNICMQS